MLDFLKNQNNSQVRVLTARELRKRKEKGVPEALMQCIKYDTDLEVVKEAISSFGRVTGYKITDVFESSPIEEWWSEHPIEVNSKLSEP